jgi:hypothetical protein
MRKQYHLIPSKNGFKAWDVDKLIQKTKNFEVIDVDLNDIEDLDKNFWYQEEDSIPTPRSIATHVRLVEETDLKYPIILGEDGRVMDGMHRVIKALNLGYKTIKAVKFKNDPKPDFVDIDPDNLEY